MSWSFSALLVPLVCFVILAEFFCENCARKRRACFLQPLAAVQQRSRLFLCACIASALAILTCVLVLLSNRCNFSTPKDGIAIVVDVPSASAEGTLWLKKTVASKLAEFFPGIPISLYELHGGALQLVCPPTIDRVFFTLQLGGLDHTETLSEGQLSIEQLRASLANNMWLIAISSQKILPKDQSTHSASCIEVEKDNLTCRVYDTTPMTTQSLETFAKAVQYRLLRTQRSTLLDSKQMLLLSFCIVGAYLLFLCWRLQRPSLHLLAAIFLLFCSPLCGSEELSAMGPNITVQEAIDLAQSGLYTESDKKLASLLHETVPNKARARLEYNRALLSYLEGDDNTALHWIQSLQQQASEKDLQKSVDTLHGLVLIRRLYEYSSSNEYLRRQAALKTWLDSSPLVNVDLLDTANLALLSSRLEKEESVRFTIHWLQNALFASQDKDHSLFLRCAENITTETNGLVQEYLRKFFDQTTLSQFIWDSSHIESLSDVNRLYIWYLLSSAHTVEESIDYLFQIGCTIINRTLYFPFFLPVLKNNLPFVQALLKQLSSSLPKDEQKILDCLCKDSPQSIEEQASSWYARMTLWPAMSQQGTARYEALATTLVNESDRPQTAYTKHVLASLSSCIISQTPPPQNCKDPLETVITGLFLDWYRLDKTTPFSFLLDSHKANSVLWDKWLESLLSFSMKQEATYSPSCSNIVASIGSDELSTFDMRLLSHLWELALTEKEPNALCRMQLYRLKDLLTELHAALSNPTNKVLKSLCLIYQQMPQIANMLATDTRRFQGKKRETYDHLLYEFNTLTEDIAERIAQPATFRLQKVRQEIATSISLVSSMMNLCSESEAGGGGVGAPRSEGSVPNVLRVESAVSLFQELDRSDRGLFKE